VRRSSWDSSCFRVSDHFCEQSDAVMMVLQLSTFSAEGGLLCGGFEKKMLDQAISRPPAGFAVWSLEPEKLQHSLYHLNSIHHNIKFMMETRK